MLPSRSRGGGVSSTCIASGVAGGRRRVAGASDMIEVRLSRRSGMPDGDGLRDHAAHRGSDDVGPRDAERGHQRDRVVRHLGERVGRRSPAARSSPPASPRRRSGRRRRRAASTSPMSRLSKRTTKKPRAASCSQNSSSQRIIWAPRPMTSTSGGAERSPKVSYSSSIPLTAARGMAGSLRARRDGSSLRAAFRMTPEPVRRPILRAGGPTAGAAPCPSSSVPRARDARRRRGRGDTLPRCGASARRRRSSRGRRRRARGARRRP